MKGAPVRLVTSHNADEGTSAKKKKRPSGNE